ncbi:glutathione peroxidase [Xanthobacter oligotrophicus]|uniref:glutathione peroxidase n=1 Tax=Xanthobacter oligotrophicus TaxID=2607286 RepID=UPI0011F1B15E|nr:glutathione peroxidase [Xanthobacter oligotrophicus]MCG5237433.1 glutathione peroxidase [Xanthobacter oligotrophicus]
MSQALFDIPLKRIDGTPATLGDFGGKVLLVVNVASKCGLTPQYAALEKLYEARHGDGLEILGFPANDFGAQEPGTESEIASFCSLTYGVTFPLFEKISVAVATRHPLYDTLVAAQPEAEGAEAMRQRFASRGRTMPPSSDVMWNFEKFVVGRDGRVIARFAPDVTPDDPRLTEALDAALAATA